MRTLEEDVLAKATDASERAVVPGAVAIHQASVLDNRIAKKHSSFNSLSSSVGATSESSRDNPSFPSPIRKQGILESLETQILAKALNASFELPDIKPRSMNHLASLEERVTEKAVRPLHFSMRKLPSEKKKVCITQCRSSKRNHFVPPLKENQISPEELSDLSSIDSISVFEAQVYGTSV
eukprot:CAMPEP_0118724548 /NCGR_PEP_ID=MMETSP0800-20121206/32639_1 /TAXON_ID=210618 ORGANISM="Striatella unipunctata, Strain CCMP2910" /NCGR_SAMPLE_ID=MMETSP0800 /ASSEMBLY_ACC=CAM_ASM_000638 /LENGTH=180 /DNA_ID=CAMNT_0006633135 /DNA_START=397 /DNA_END=936 /DNA_ORIENTATION=+